MNDEKEITFEDEEINIDLTDEVNIIVNEDHSKLQNLDYENSGHIGFASSQDIEEVNERINLLDNNKVPKRLNLMPNLSGNSNRRNAFIYIDNNGVENKVSIAQMLSYLIRQGESIPSDMQVGEYLFKEIKKD